MKQVRLSVVFVVLSLVLVFAGCSKPPDAEKQAAKTAMDAALSAGADKYAAADLDTAKKKWDAAESQMKEKKYEEAKQAYIEARAAFEKVAGAVEAGKKAMTDQANAALTSVQEAWKNLEATAKKMKKKMEKKMKDKKETWMTDAKAIREELGKAKEMIGSDPAGAKAKLEELKALIAKWENTLKEMATAPEKPKATKKKKK